MMCNAICSRKIQKNPIYPLNNRSAKSKSTIKLHRVNILPEMIDACKKPGIVEIKVLFEFLPYIGLHTSRIRLDAMVSSRLHSVVGIPRYQRVSYPLFHRHLLQPLYTGRCSVRCYTVSIVQNVAH